jgi:predicted ATP-grasp superfamily ATP-dependent carboligase
MAILVTDGQHRATLAVVRSLGREGIPVTVGSSGLACLAGRSRYCADTFSYPSPEEEAPNFQSAVRNRILSGQYRVLLPMTDLTMQLVGEIRESICSSVAVPIPGIDQIRLVQDKRAMFQHAERIGIACPDTIGVESFEALEGVAAKVKYPAVIKPRSSWFYRDGRYVSGNVSYARTPGEMIAQYRSLHAKIPDPLVQERIIGEGRGVFLLMWNGEVKAAFCHRRVREKPPWGGVSVYSESMPFDESLFQKSARLLKSIGWQGVAMVEYKIDEKDNQPKFMEVNGRFWGSLQLAVSAGINFPLLLYHLATGVNVQPQYKYRTGVKCRWLLGDLDHLWIRLRYPSPFNGHTPDLFSQIRACGAFLKFYEPRLHYDVFQISDPGPGWYECKKYIRDMWQSFRASARRA